MAYDAPDYKELMRQYNDAMKMINTLRKERDACAATPWSYDLDAAPRGVELLWLSTSFRDGRPCASCARIFNDNFDPAGNGDMVFYDEDMHTIPLDNPIAWAHINMPKDTQCQQK